MSHRVGMTRQLWKNLDAHTFVIAVRSKGTTSAFQIIEWQSGSKFRKTVVAILSLLLAITKIPINALTLSSVTRNILFFNAGVLLKEYRVRILGGKPTKWLIPISGGMLILWASLLFSPIGNRIGIPIAFIGIITCYFFTKFQSFNCIFERFGRFSLQLYLLNGFFIGCLTNLSM